jgi:TolB protein
MYSSSAGAADMFHHLYVLPVEGGYPYKMTFGDHEDFSPRWSPDGEQIAYISNEGGLPQLVIMETYGGRKTKVAINDLKWKRPMGSLAVKVVDDATGKPVHARIQGAAADGKFYAPRTAYSRVVTQGHVFHTDGQYQVDMPPGRFTLQAVRGFEYLPQQMEVEIVAGKTKELTLRLRRMTDLGPRGWYNGSTHVHMNYGGNLRNTLENLVFMSKAEDQDVVNELVANKDNRILDWQYFVPGGGEHPVTQKDPSLKVIVGEEYRPPFYGHVFFLGLRDHLISPFLTGYEMTGVESLYPSNTDMFRKAAAQGAVTGYVHAFSGENDPLDSSLGVAKGFPVDAALGTVHCLEWSASSRASLAVWHHALNNDLKITPTGGEDSISNLHLSKLVGSVRTYAYLGKDFSAAAWIDALKKGKTFFTSGPLLDLKINGRIPGEEIKLPAAGGTVEIVASVQSITPLSKVVVHHNGTIWKELTLSADKLSATLNAKAPVTASGWYSLYAEGEPTPMLDTTYPQAATNAVRVYVGNQRIRNAQSAEYFIKWIDKLHAMAEDWSMWRSQKEKDHVYAQFREARAIYENFRKQ